MDEDTRWTIATNGDPPRRTLEQFAGACGVAPVQIIRWAWVGRIPHPTRVGRRWLWRRSEVAQVARDGPAMVGFYTSLAHYDGIRMLRASIVAECRAKKKNVSDTGTVFGRRKGVR